MIKIADREGWETVKEYVSDDLAFDTEDEKLLAKAIMQAAAKKEKRKRQKTNLSAHGKPSLRSTNYGNFRQAAYRRSYEPKPQGTCWSCGKIGHFQWQCYTKQKRDTKYDKRIENNF